MEKLVSVNGNDEYLIPFFSIKTDYFNKEFIIDKEKFKDIYKKHSEELDYRRYKIVGKHLFKERFDKTITVWGNENNLGADITFNFGEYRTKIQKYLNIKNIVSIEDKNFKSQMYDKIDLLRSVRKEERLKTEFPLIHNLFVEGNKVYIVPYSHSCGMSPSMRYFPNNQAVYFEAATNNIEEIRKAYVDYSIKDCTTDNVDINKLNLYYAYRLMQIIKENKYEFIISKAVEVLSNYFYNPANDINTIITLEDGKSTLSYLDLLSTYSRYTYGKAIKTWTIAPQGRDRTKVFHPPLKAMSDEEFKRLYDLNTIKYNFYESLPYMGMARGKYANVGYYAFFFPNGEIILDKLCYPDDPFVVSHYGNSIFNLNIYNFELLSHVDKTTLRKSKMCPFTTHQGNWQERVTKMIEIPATQETIDNTRKLIKKIELKG